MKPRYCLLFLIFITPLVLNAQLKVNIVPKDTTYCIGQFLTPFSLGSKLQIENGQGPYQISWECYIPITERIIVTASRLFVDTTVIDPVFKDVLYSNWYTIKVTVKDHLNNVASDSLRIRFSGFIYTLGYEEINLALGDSIYSYSASIAGGIEPLRYEYFPKNGLSDPYSKDTWIKPETSTIYNQQATDSCGCVSELNTVVDINVLVTESLSIEGKKGFDMRISNNNLLFENFNNEETLVFIYTLKGDLAYSCSTKSNGVDVSMLKKASSVYLIKLIRADKMDIKKIKI